MPDHVHVLMTPSIDQSTARCVQLIKGGYSHALSSQSAVWHIGHHEHRIRDPADFNSQLNSIANNPQRKNYADFPHVPIHFPHLLYPAPSLSGH
jgi:putative transposase